MTTSLIGLFSTSSIIGLFTLILLELVLGVDNLVFIVLLASKLPKAVAKKATIIGLSCALLTRILLLFFIGWASTLTKPLFTFLGVGFAARNIILLFGGMFLIAKTTLELHQRIEGEVEDDGISNVGRSAIWQVVAQIVVLDAIFSFDSIITAVGMVHEVWIMVTAIVIAMIIMMLSVNNLLKFLQNHPTVIVLCLGFLLMIGFSLVVEAFNLEISKGYLYAAIGFSIAIETINQFAYRNKKRHVTTNDLRRKTANTVLRLLSGKKDEDYGSLADVMDAISEKDLDEAVFKSAEKEMIRGVLDLAERPVRSIMTPRNEVEWLDISYSDEQIKKEIKEISHNKVIVAREVVDEFVGVIEIKDLQENLLEGKKINWKKFMRQPQVIPESTDVLSLMEKMRQSEVQVAIIVDEHGSFEGMVTPTDVFKAIAGGFIHEDDDESNMLEEVKPGEWLADGSIDIRYLSSVLEKDLVDESDRYSTLAGYLLWQFGYIPNSGEIIKKDGFLFEVRNMERRNISLVKIQKLEEKDPDAISAF